MSLPTLVNLTHYTADVFKLDVTVSFDPDQETTSLAGGSAIVKAKSRSTGTVVTGSGTIDVGENKVRATFPAAALSRGVYDLQVAVVISGEQKTIVAGTLTVKESI